ncbi:MAG: 23S rRNA (pseudouridine(1915)-N(3))-methyltransferase RlmH [Clostridia bacterium]|nr:23S rRNA (pseudouridine(1915)-N(3))-methyltransferase RlmH [Clostridia bacterium]
MNCLIVCVGTIKEDYYTQAVHEYATRLSRFDKVCIIEVPEARVPKNPSDADIENVKKQECANLQKQIKGYVIALDKVGKKLTSEEFSEKLDKLSQITSTVTFVIGGSYGLTEEFRKSADYLLSFSDFTFPHQLMRVILLEQLYRATTISKNITYHK